MGRFEDGVAASSAFSLDDAFDIAESEYAEDFRAYWGFDTKQTPEGLEEDEWRELQRMQGLAHQIAEVAASLLQRKGLGKDRLLEPQLLASEAERANVLVHQFLDMVSKEDWVAAHQALLPTDPSDPRTRFNVFRNALQLEAARLFPYSPAQTASRLSSLVQFLVRFPGSRAAAYLSRVAKCYVLDMRPELAVMARAVLDAAIEEFADDASVRRLLRLSSNERIGLDARIQFCAVTGAFDEACVRAARIVKRAGDTAVHSAPGLEAVADEILEALTVALAALEKAKGGR